jgi:SAM-dependent methyltransferase
MPDSTRQKSAHGWNSYWKGTSDAQAYESGGVGHPGFAAFWQRTLGECLEHHHDPRILDIATGSGAIIESLERMGSLNLRNISCIDISEAAIQSVQERFPGVSGVVADATRIPLPNDSFDIVTSQFGAEYAGPAAVNEAARLLAPGGEMLFLMHYRSGTIHRICSMALDAIRRTEQSGFVDRALVYFEAGFAAVRGADRAPYDQAGAELNPAIRAIEAVLRDHGGGVGGGTIQKLYDDVRTIHSRIQHYDPDEVLDWLRTMKTELSAYEARMASMCDCALDEETLEEHCVRLASLGLDILQREPLFLSPNNAPYAWVLRARKPNAS